MNTRRFMSVMVLLLVLVMSVSLLVACGGDKSVGGMTDDEKELFGDGGGEKVELDAFDILLNAYENWITSPGYKRVQNFSFVAKAPGKTITSNTRDVYKIDGNKLYRQMVTIQDSKPFKGNKNEITRFYFDGTNAQSVVINDKDYAPGVIDENDPDKIFEIAEMPSMEAYTGDDVSDKIKTYKEHLTTYIWNDKANLVDNGFEVTKDDKGNLHFTIVINCTKDMMDSVHTAARDEFLSSTGASEGTLEMRADTTIEFVVEEFEEGEYRFLGWKRTESYQGKAMNFAKIPADQVSIETFSYDPADYTITAEDIA